MTNFTVKASQLTKNFGKQKVIDTIDFSFSAPQTIAITGINGKGKSTLIQLISGYFSPSSGSIEYSFGQSKIKIDDLFQYVSIAAPYLDLIENMTLTELVVFHLNHKPAQNNLKANDLMDLAYLSEHATKMIDSFSSGMKQRLKLVLALTSQTPVILLDEPVSNLDEKAKKWFQETFHQFCQDKLVFIATNSVKEEVGLCSHIFAL
jgi:ABC-type multidrug transport system ATPase subunit